MSEMINLLKEVGGQVRERRVAASLSQAAAATAAGIGRSTLIHLEQGRKDVRLSKVLSVANAIGASFGLGGVSPEQAERHRLRAEEAVRLAARRQAHLKIALGLALGSPRALRELRDARAMIAIWKRDRTCSDHYIRGWSRILAGSPAQVARRIGDIDEDWLDAMLQNTPFSRALSKP